MIRLTRDMLKGLPASTAREISPAPDRLLQLALDNDPWRVAVASMLLCRTTRRQAEPTLRDVLRKWPTAAALAGAEGLESVVRRCGLHRQRARQMQRASSMWCGEGWSELGDLPGCGVYVRDAVGLVCFGCLELESGDAALAACAAVLRAEEVRCD